jgi:hypothetical protein
LQDQPLTEAQASIASAPSLEDCEFVLYSCHFHLLLSYHDANFDGEEIMGGNWRGLSGKACGKQAAECTGGDWSRGLSPTPRPLRDLLLQGLSAARPACGKQALPPAILRCASEGYSTPAGMGLGESPRSRTR